MNGIVQNAAPLLQKKMQNVISIPPCMSQIPNMVPNYEALINKQELGHDRLHFSELYIVKKGHCSNSVYKYLNSG